MFQAFMQFPYISRLITATLPASKAATLKTATRPAQATAPTAGLIAALLGLALLIITVVGGGSTCPAAAAETTTTIRLAYPHKIQYAPMIIGSAAGGPFAAAGLKIAPVIGTGGIDAAEALLAGAADIGAMGDNPAAILLSRSRRFRVICGFMESPGMHRLVAGPHRGIASVADLPGKRVAVHHGSSTHGALLAHLEAEGIVAAAVTLVPLSPVNFPEALQHGAVDAVAGSAPWPQNVLDRVPGAREIAVLSVPGNTFPHVLIAGRDYIDAHPDELRQLLTVLAAISIDITADPEPAAAAVAAVTGRERAAELRALAPLTFRLDFSPAVTNGLRQTAAFLQRRGRIRTLPADERLIPVEAPKPERP
jgi:ABC-type nitrate/sulfonate/bicarbonate transport system substrate-binding protein